MIFIMKTLLNNKEDFEHWKSWNYRYIHCPDDEEYPNNYPCVVVEHIEMNGYGDEDYLHYQFVYLENFKE